MSLEKVGVNNIYNDLSPELRKKLDAKVLSFGKKVRYKFDISNSDPNPDNKGGKIWPFRWTLDPITFMITDTYENRANAQKVKRIGIVETINDKGEPERFKRIVVSETDKGVLTFDLEKHEDVAAVWFLELHPKLSGGDFADKTKRQVVTRIDEQAAANTERAERTIRKKAMDIAENMTDKEVVDFADAMSASDNLRWDSTQDIGVLRNAVEKLAETDPKFFNDLVESKSLEYQAVIKQAMNKSIIVFDHGEYNFKWVSNGQTFASLQPTGNKNEVEKLADLLQAGGAKYDATYKKIKSLATDKAVVA